MLAEGVLDGSMPLDEHVFRVRWSPDGRHMQAAFASGVVRIWDAALTERPLHVLSTSGSHVLATAGGEALSGGTGGQSLASHHPFRGLAAGRVGVPAHKSAGSSQFFSGGPLTRPVWAATDVTSLSASSQLLAVTAAPLFPLSKAQDHSHAGAGAAAGGHGAGSRGSSLAGFFGFGSGYSSSSSGSGSSTAAPPSTASLASPTGSGLFSSLPGFCGWGLHLFDLRQGDTAVLLAAEYPAYAGCTSLLYDVASLSLVVGGSDGALMLFDLRTGRMRLRMEGVPMAAGGSRGSAAASLASPAAPAEDIVTLEGYAHAGAVLHLAAHPSQRLFASAGQDGDIRLWSLPELQHCSTIDRVHAPRVLDPAAVAVTTAGGAVGGAAAAAASHPSQWLYPGGVSSLSFTEELLLSSGHDGAVYAMHQLW